MIGAINVFFEVNMDKSGVMRLARLKTLKMIVNEVNLQ
jgi:hypothetical protein